MKRGERHSLGLRGEELFAFVTGMGPSQERDELLKEADVMRLRAGSAAVKRAVGRPGNSDYASPPSQVVSGMHAALCREPVDRDSPEFWADMFPTESPTPPSAGA